jgi:hypothetical protein
MNRSPCARSSDHPALVEARVSTKPVLSLSKYTTRTGIYTSSGRNYSVANKANALNNMLQCIISAINQH